MPPRAWSAKDERQYEHIKESTRRRGGRAAKRAEEIAARTVNKRRAEEGRTKQQRSQASRSGLEERTVAELKQRAKQLGLSGYSGMRKRELIAALRKAA